MFFGVGAGLVMIILFPSALHIMLILVGLMISKKRAKFRDIESVTIVIPTRDEEVLIQEKLQNIKKIFETANVENVLFYDCSVDGTVDIIRKFIIDEGFDNVWKVIENCEVGKSNSVSRAIREINSEIMILTDADAVFSESSFSNLLRALSRTDVMAACGVDRGDKSLYRIVSNLIRIAESNFGASVVFEGSICGFKLNYLNPESIDVTRNADDSQLAVSVQRNGGRAIYVGDCSFMDLKGVINSRERQVRRSQGLVRHLYRETINPENSSIIRIVSLLNLHLFMIMPLGLGVAFLVTIGHMTGMMNEPFFQIIDSRVAFFSLLFLNFLLARRAYFVYLGVIMLFRGSNLAVWKPLRESAD